MSARLSLPLRAYLAFAAVALPLWRFQLHRRSRRGKEDPARLPERLGERFAPRHGDQVIWMHALSVGESLALLPLIDHALQALPRAQIVLTTATRTSAQAIARAGLPERAVHQMLPVDVPSRIAAFLEHWQPSVAVFSELDLWPATLVGTHRRGVPMVLINCRFSDKNLARRQRGAAVYADLLGLFRAVLLQDAESLDRFRRLGARTDHMQVTGALKGAARPLECDRAELRALRAAIGARPVWLAASTHAREDAAVAEAHHRVRSHLGDTLLIVAPRHPDSADATAAALAGLGPVARRSRGQVPGPDTAVYLADTIGEMGLWYRLAPVTFVAHSLDVGDPPLRGKNPFEAIALNSAVLHGPAVVDFSETYAELDAAGAALPAATPEEIAGAVVALQDPDRIAALRGAARAVVDRKKDIVARTWEVIATRMG